MNEPSPRDRARAIVKAAQQRRQQATYAQSRGAEKLQELEAQFFDLRGEYAISADLARDDAKQLCLPVRANDEVLCTWRREGETLIGEFKGRPPLKAATASEAFDQTIEIFAEREIRV
jgi:hypothetical protein